MTRRLVPLICAIALLPAFASVPATTPEASAQDPASSAPRIAPEMVQTGRLRFLSSAGDFGGTVLAPDGTARIWNYNPDSRDLLLFDPGIGQRLWHSRLPGAVSVDEASTVTICCDGAVLVFATEQQLIAVNGHAGEFLWSHNTRGEQLTIEAPAGVTDTVLAWRMDHIRSGNIDRNLRAIGFDAATGEERWSIHLPEAEGLPQVWRGFFCHPVPNPDAAGEEDTMVQQIRHAGSGEVVFECDYLADDLHDNAVLTARMRSGMNRSVYLLPDGEGGLGEVEWVWPEELGMDGMVMTSVPLVDAPLVHAIWQNEHNPELARKTFAVRENGLVCECTLLDTPDDVNFLDGVAINDSLVVLMYRHEDRSRHVIGTNTITGEIYYDFTPDDLGYADPEPDELPMFGVRFELTRAGENLGFVIEIRQPQVKTFRVINPLTGDASAPRSILNSGEPFSLTGGAFAWVEGDAMMVYRAGLTGNLTLEPPAGDAVAMARVLGEAQRWLLNEQKRNGAWEGRGVVPLLGSINVLERHGDDLLTTALAGLALTASASDEFDEFGLLRRGGMRRAVRWVCNRMNDAGYIKSDFTCFIDHCLALEFLIRALPDDWADTTALHREAVVRGLRYTINQRHRDGGFARNLDLPVEFWIPQARPDMTGRDIAEAVNRQDAGSPITAYVSQRVFRAAMRHDALRELAAPEMEKNTRWVMNVALRNNNMMADIVNLGMVLSGFGRDMGDENQPAQMVTDLLFERIPSPIIGGRRGRVEGTWWYMLPDMVELFSRYGSDRRNDLLNALEAWLYTSRYPDGHHVGLPGSVKTTAIAALTAYELDR